MVKPCLGTRAEATGNRGAGLCLVCSTLSPPYLSGSSLAGAQSASLCTVSPAGSIASNSAAVLRCPGRTKSGRISAKRLKDKPPLVRPGVRKNEKLAVAQLVCESNQVEIQRAGFVQDLLGPAAKFLFQNL